MPILIDELVVELEPAGVPDSDPGAGAELVPGNVDEHEVLCLLDLIDERRARLAVD
jgi:hypothetical protein